MANNWMEEAERWQSEQEEYQQRTPGDTTLLVAVIVMAISFVVLWFAW